MQVQAAAGHLPSRDQRPAGRHGRGCPAQCGSPGLWPTRAGTAAAPPSQARAPRLHARLTKASHWPTAATRPRRTRQRTRQQRPRDPGAASPPTPCRRPPEPDPRRWAAAGGCVRSPCPVARASRSLPPGLWRPSGLSRTSGRARLRWRPSGLRSASSCRGRGACSPSELPLSRRGSSGCRCRGACTASIGFETPDWWSSRLASWADALRGLARWGCSCG